MQAVTPSVLSAVHCSELLHPDGSTCWSVQSVPPSVCGTLYCTAKTCRHIHTHTGQYTQSSKMYCLRYTVLYCCNPVETLDPNMPTHSHTCWTGQAVHPSVLSSVHYCVLLQPGGNTRSKHADTFTHILDKTGSPQKCTVCGTLYCTAATQWKH